MPRFPAYGIIARSAQLGVGALSERPDREPLSPGDLFARLSFPRAPSQAPGFGRIGEPRVNILQLNLALDQLKSL
jgi:hypothetical protein